MQMYERIFEDSKGIINRVINSPDQLNRILDISNFKENRAAYKERISDVWDFVTNEEDNIREFIDANQINDISIDIINKEGMQLFKNLTNLMIAE